MAKLSSRVIWGTILIIGGLLFLLESLGLMIIGSIWPVIFGIAGIFFMVTFFRDTMQWWPVIPGLTLIGLAIMIFLNTVAPKFAQNISSGIFLGCIGLSFIAILLATRGQQWWAMIPGGVLLTIAVVTSVSSYADGNLSGALFMLGLATTFALLYFIPFNGEKRGWAIYPFIILGVIGILILGATAQIAQYLWPAVLIILGLYVIIKNSQRSS
jgi:hypothetical protein